MATQPGVTDRELVAARTFARVLDRYGLDPILGFVLPELGDLIGAVLGLYIVSIALRRGMSKVLVARMVLNLGVDLALGIVPFLGDIGDFFFKANERNLKLLETREVGGPARASDWLVLGGAFAALFAMIGLVIYAMISLVRWMF